MLTMKHSLAISLASAFLASPAIAYDGVKSLGWLLVYVSDEGGGKYCFNEVLSTIPGGPTTAQLIAMFSSDVVEGSDGRVFALNSGASGSGFPAVAEVSEAKGLYEIIDQEGSCVVYDMLVEDDSDGIEQIVYGGNWVERFQVIGVDSNHKIWAFYEDDLGHWTKKKTVWGDARPGTLTEVTTNSGGSSIAGVSKGGHYFHLWGDFDNFNYSRQSDISCSSKPAGIGDWSGKWAQFRGNYCPMTGDNRLHKYTWRGGGGTTKDDLMWESASFVTRVSESSNIYGISSKGNLLTLAKNGDINKGGAILVVPMHPTLLRNKSIDALGGIGDNEEEGIYVTAQGKLYNVYWEGACDALTYNWEAEEVTGLWDKLHDIPTCNAPKDMVFGNHDGETFFLFGSGPVNLGECYHTTEGHYTLYRLNGKVAEDVQHGFPRCDSGIFGC